jgi:regulator of nonsense transcripts 1
LGYLILSDRFYHRFIFHLLSWCRIYHNGKSYLFLFNNAGSGYMPFGPLSNGGGQKGGVPPHASLTPSRGVPLTGFPSTPLTQPYAIPSRGGMHGPIGALPQGPQAGSRGFGTGRGSTSGPIGGHLSHHQASQQQGALGGAFGFGGLDSPATQASLGGPMTQQGILTQMQAQTLSQNLRDGFTLGGMSQDFFGEDFKSQGSHVGYTGQEFATQAGFGMDYNTQANQGGYGGDFITQNSQPGYAHQSVGSDFISQVSRRKFVYSVALVSGPLE